LQSRGLQLPGSRYAGDSKLASLYDRDSSARRNNLLAVGGASATAIRIKDEEGIYGELDFEESFADDEERNEGDDYAMGEEETKELEQKIKRELARAEEEDKDEDDDLFDPRGRKLNSRGEDDVLTGSGKQMKKIMKALARREGNDVYDDDDEDRNPYGSDDSSDGVEDSVMANPEEALRKVREEKEREAKEAARKGIKTEDASANVSRAPSPTPKSDVNSGVATPAQVSARNKASGSQHRKPGAGHATSAQRATSPNRPSNGSNKSRQGSRSGSPIDERSSSLKRKSEVAGGSNNGKRPRTSTQQTSGPSSPVDTTSPRSASPSRQSTSGRASASSTSIAPPNELEMEIIRLVQTGKATTAKELITHFKSRLNSSLRESFGKAVIRVLNTNNPQKTLSVKPGLVD
jgi:transcription initiation factor TFIIF subunit alpha